MQLLAFILGFFASLFLLLAAAAWLRVARSLRDPVSAHLLRPAAWATGIAFSLLGLALLVAAVDWAAQQKIQAWGSLYSEEQN